MELSKDTTPYGTRKRESESHGTTTLLPGRGRARVTWCFCQIH